MHTRLSALLGVLLVAGGCTTQQPALPNDDRAVNTGTYPRFALTPRAATNQFGSADASANISDLEQTAATTANVGRPSPSIVRDLERTRATHERETIARIEG